MSDPRARVSAALKLQMADRPPFCFWAHHYIREQAAEELAAHTVRVARYFRYDFARIVNRDTFFAECWGLRLRPPVTYHTPPEVIEAAVRGPADLAGIKPLDPGNGPLAQQLAVLRQVKQEMGPEFPVLQPLPSPLTVLAQLLAQDQAEQATRLRLMLAEHPRAARQALAAITETAAAFAREAIGARADGLHFLIRLARPDGLSRAEYSEFGLDDDRTVMLRALGAWFNVVQVGGTDAYLEEIRAVPCDAIDLGGTADVPLNEVRDRYGKAVIGGVNPDPLRLNLTGVQVEEEASRALTVTGGRGFILGPGSPMDPQTPEDLLLSARHALLSWSHASSAGGGAGNGPGSAEPHRD